MAGRSAVIGEGKMNLKVFVCGPITNACHTKGFDPNVKAVVESLVEFLEKAGIETWSAHRLESYGKEIPEFPEHVYTRDWHYASTCSSLVAVLPSDSTGTLYRTDGTFIELGWATALRKRLIIVTDPEATGRSYLLDGLVEACKAVLVPIDDPLRNEKVLNLLCS